MFIPCSNGGRASRRGHLIAICNSWSKFAPHFLFSGERKDCARRRVSEANRRGAAALGPETNGPFTVQKKRAFCELGGKLWLVGTLTRSPNRLASAPNPAAAAAVGGIDGPFSVQSTIMHLLGRFPFCQQYSRSPANWQGSSLVFVYGNLSKTFYFIAM